MPLWKYFPMYFLFLFSNLIFTWQTSVISQQISRKRDVTEKIGICHSIQESKINKSYLYQIHFKVHFAHSVLLIIKIMFSNMVHVHASLLFIIG